MRRKFFFGDVVTRDVGWGFHGVKARKDADQEIRIDCYVTSYHVNR